MSALIALVTAINRANAPVGQYRIAGLAEVAGAPEDSAVSWEVFANYDAASAATNQACRDAAVSAAIAAGFSVAPPDQKTLFGGAVLI